MRTTKAEVEGVFKLWINSVGGHVAKSYNDVGGYRLDHNNVYGGYQVIRISNAQGGQSDNVFLNTRLSAYPFVCALRAAMRSIEELRLNQKGA
jgi:hypothetical protein